MARRRARRGPRPRRARRPAAPADRRSRRRRPAPRPTAVRRPARPRAGPRPAPRSSPSSTAAATSPCSTASSTPATTRARSPRPSAPAVEVAPRARRRTPSTSCRKAREGARQAPGRRGAPRAAHQGEAGPLRRRCRRPGRGRPGPGRSPRRSPPCRTCSATTTTAPSPSSGSPSAAAAATRAQAFALGQLVARPAPRGRPAARRVAIGVGRGRPVQAHGVDGLTCDRLIGAASSSGPPAAWCGARARPEARPEPSRCCSSTAPATTTGRSRRASATPARPTRTARVREVAEETGLRVHARPRAARQRPYIDGRGRPKVVRYWEMTVAEDLAWEPGDEVDELRLAARRRWPSGGSPTGATSRCSTPSPAGPAPGRADPPLPLVSRRSRSRLARLVHRPFTRRTPAASPTASLAFAAASPCSLRRGDSLAQQAHQVGRRGAGRRPRCSPPAATTTTTRAPTSHRASGSGEAGTSGATIAISGSSTVAPISAHRRRRVQRGGSPATITVDDPGTGDGFALFCEGETDIADASRPINEEEAAACEAAGIEYIELEVAFDGITVMTNPANDAVECLNFADLYALVGPESDGVDNWGDAAALADRAGLDHRAPRRRRSTSRRPGTESGTYDAFVELALGDPAEARVEAGAITEDQVETIRTDYSSQADDNAIIAGIEGSDTQLRLGRLRLRRGCGRRDQGDRGRRRRRVRRARRSRRSPTAATRCRARCTSTSTRPSAEENPAVAEYVDFYLDGDSLDALVEEAGYVPLPDDRRPRRQERWDGPHHRTPPADPLGPASRLGHRPPSRYRPLDPRPTAWSTPAEWPPSPSQTSEGNREAPPQGGDRQERSSEPRRCCRSSSASSSSSPSWARPGASSPRSTRRSLWGDNWAPRSEQFSIKALLTATLLVTGIAMLIAAPARARLGDLPLRVRQPAGAPHAQADPRGPRRHPVGGPRLLLRQLHLAEHRAAVLRRAPARSACSPPASASGSSPIPLIASVSEDAMRSVPARPPRGELRARGPQDHDVASGWSCRRRCPAWSPRSSSPSPGPSARRWSCCSPPARPTRSQFTRTRSRRA